MGVSRKKTIAVSALVVWLGVRWYRQRQRRSATGLTAAQERFVQRATTLEAQQVPFYHILAMKAHRLGLLHLEAGYMRAMEVETRHLRELKLAGRRLRIPLATWELLGDRIGRLSGSIISALDPKVGLNVVNQVEQVAAKEYASQREGLTDPALQELYIRNQVDEEEHYAWAALMLEQSQPPQADGSPVAGGE